MFAAIIAVCSWISVPAPVPFTLQTLAVYLAAGLLTGTQSLFAVLAYILLGAIGVPVFSGFRGGLGALFGYTGGYIVGFIFVVLSVAVFGKLFKNRIAGLILSYIIGTALCYAFGTIWFALVYADTNGEAIGFFAVLMKCVVPFLIPDALKITLASIIVPKIKGVLEREK